MHCIHFFVLAFLGVASTTPIKNNVKDDLRKAAEETALLIDHEKLKAMIELSQKVIDSQRIEQKDVAKWQAFHDKMAVCNETWAINGQTDDCQPIYPDGLEPKMESPGDLYYYSNGAIVNIFVKCRVLETLMSIELITKAKQIIRASKGAEYTDKDFDLFYNMFDLFTNSHAADLVQHISSINV